jgi:hypothetical protein
MQKTGSGFSFGIAVSQWPFSAADWRYFGDKFNYTTGIQEQYMETAAYATA